MQSLQARLRSHRAGWNRCHSAQHAVHCHRTGRQLHLPCRAAATAAKQAEAERIAEELPQSREAAIQQAAAAVSAQLGAGLIKKRKAFQSGSIKRLKLDVPQADNRPQAVTALAQDCLRQLPEEVESQLTVLFCNDKVAEHASQHSSLKGRCKSLGDAFIDSLTGPLLIVGPTVDQLEKVDVLLSQWRGRVAILLNAEWTPDTLPSGFKAFDRSFDVVYCFFPVNFQVFVYKREAILYKYVRKGSPAATPWFVMLKDGKRWKCIARQQTRPNAENLEAAFYNASAAESPINKGVQFLKGLTGKS